MSRETRDALQAVLIRLQSLAPSLTQLVEHQELVRFCESCEHLIKSLDQEPLD